ncbi:unnamed protein product [Phytophthora lilii]|uniref:Unnamed protein product n=1 Tax=Phytophthora lilii TaxID=2077276 RepID=A0A9W6U5A4_9STRA|nr:unnamed protein product [Phytophthora lilii]
MHRPRRSNEDLPPNPTDTAMASLECGERVEKSDPNAHCRSTTLHEFEVISVCLPHRHLHSESTLVVIEGGINTAKDKEALLQDGEFEVKREPSGRVKLKSLNGLRGLASLFIVHHHAGYLLDATLGPSSVDAFFVLSAFLLTNPNTRLITCKESASKWIIVLLDYFVKRIMRVYPLFAVVAVVLTCLPKDARTHYYNLAHENIRHWSLWKILTLKKRYYLLWTRPIEITYYFMIPVFWLG